MRCLVTGAYGFIGREVAQALAREGVTVIGAGRDVTLGKRFIPGIEWIACDFNSDVEIASWLPRLDGIDAVVNFVGILQSSLADNAERIHGRATIALFEAAAAAGVRRIIHVSAVSAETELATGYARSKADADAALAGLDVNWVIVKPSLVVGRGSYGGTSLMRGLAGLPYVLPLPGEAAERFQPIAIDDLARGIATLATGSEPSRATLFAAGGQAISIRDILVTYRAWLGLPVAREIAVPLPLLKLVLRLGDIAGAVGFASALRTTSLAQMRHDLLVDGSAFAAASGGNIKSFNEALAAWPATLQDRLHARTYFLAPLLQIAIALFWVLSGITALIPQGFASATVIAEAAGLALPLARAQVAATAILDVVLGVLFLLPRWVRRAGGLQLIMSGIYLVMLTLIAPRLWADPLGPLLKLVPIMAATAMVMAFQEKR